MTKKITDLPALSEADPSDNVPLVDDSANITKQTTITGLTPGIISTLLGSTLFGTAAQTYTNAGAGGGTGYYLDLGGIKLCFGKTATTIDISASGFVQSNFTLYLPPSFFSDDVVVHTWASETGNTTHLYTSGGAVTGDQVELHLMQSFGANGHAKINWVAFEVSA